MAIPLDEHVKASRLEVNQLANEHQVAISVGRQQNIIRVQSSNVRFTSKHFCFYFQHLYSIRYGIINLVIHIDFEKGEAPKTEVVAHSLMTHDDPQAVPVDCAEWLAEFWNEYWQTDTLDSIVVVSAGLTIMRCLELEPCHLAFGPLDLALAALGMQCIAVVEVETKFVGELPQDVDQELALEFKGLQLDVM